MAVSRSESSAPGIADSGARSHRKSALIGKKLHCVFNTLAAISWGAQSAAGWPGIGRRDDTEPLVFSVHSARPFGHRATVLGCGARRVVGEPRPRLAANDAAQ